MLLKNKQIDVINKKEDNWNKVLKTIIWVNEKYRGKIENTFFVQKKYVEKYVEIDKRMKPEDLVIENIILVDMGR